MRRVLIAAVVVVLAAVALVAAPAGGRARSESTTWVTTYSGAYAFADYFRGPPAADGAVTTITRTQDYGWTFEIKDVVTERDGVPHATRTERLIAAGMLNGSDGSSCTYSSDGAEHRVPVGGVPEGTTTTGDPLIGYSWNVPDKVGTPGLIVKGCDLGSGSILLDTPADSGTVSLPLPPTHAFDEAFNGSSSERLTALPTRPMKVGDAIKGSAPLGGGGIEVAAAGVAGVVTFCRCDHIPAQEVDRQKLDAALTEVRTSITIPAAPASLGKPQKLYLFEFPPGVLKMLVSLGAKSRAVSGGTTGSLLLSGSARTSAARPTVVTLTPTAAGAATLAAPHGPLAVTIELTFNPSGAGATQTVSGGATLAANPPS